MSDTGTSIQRVLLVGWNLASWELINPLLDEGQLPNLQVLVDTGVIGSLRTRRPLIEQVVYNSLATGKYADKHGVFGPLEVGSDNSIRPSDSLSRRAKAVWEVLSENDIRCNVVNFPVTGPAEKVNGVFVTPSFFESKPEDNSSNVEVPPYSVNPQEQLEALRQFVVTLEDIDAQIMGTFVPRFRELDVADPRLIAIGAAVARTFSVHSVATWLMEHAPWDVMCVTYDLMDLLGRHFFQYQFSKKEWIDEAKFELFSDVVASAVRLCDRLLGRLLELADEDTAVMIYSPWGMLKNPDLPAPDEAASPTNLESIYRGEGIFLMRAPGMPADELLHQVGFLDICPTVLRLCGLQVDDDVDGSPVQDHVEHKVNEDNRPDAWTHQGLKVPSTDFVQAISRPQSMRFTEPFAEKLARRVEEENLWTLAAVQLAADRSEDVLPLLLRLYHANPLRVERGHVVAEALYRTGYVKEAIDLMRPLAVVFKDNPIGQFMGGFVALNQGKLDRAKEMFERAEANNPPFPILFYYLGQVYLLLDMQDQAVQAFTRFVERDPCLPYAYVGLSEALLRSGRFEDAAEAALSAVGSRFSEPAMHIALGRAMVQLGDPERAREAYETALRLAPNNDLASQHLQWLDQYPNAPDRHKSADVLRRLTPPLHPKISAQTKRREVVEDSLREINEWRNVFMDELEAGERRLDEYLVGNVYRQTAKAANPLGTDGNESDPVAVLRKENWTVRPVEPADQAAIQHMSFRNPFSNPAQKEILVTHPVGSREISGAVMLEWTEQEPSMLRLRLSLAPENQEAPSGVNQQQIQLSLLRSGLARSAAGGARQVKFTVRDDQGYSSLHHSLQLFGFGDLKVQEIFQISSVETRDIGLGLLERYRQRKRIPSDIRLVSLNEVPFEQADIFLRQWFADGTGDPPSEFHLPECPVLLKGNQIIACAVGYIKDADTFVVTRIGVLPEYRKQWATPWLLGGASKVSADFGRPKLEFIIDESQYADWVKIARRHFNARHTATMRTMVLDFNPS